LHDDRRIRIRIHTSYYWIRIREVQKHVDPVDPDPQHWSPPNVLNVPSLLKVVRILQARAEKLVVGPKGRYRGSESREEELHEHLFYSQVN
jgi:hypothetical protein